MWHINGQNFISLFRIEKVLHRMVKFLHKWSMRQRWLLSSEDVGKAVASVICYVAVHPVFNPRVKNSWGIQIVSIICILRNIGDVFRLKVYFLTRIIQFEHSKKYKREHWEIELKETCYEKMHKNCLSLYGFLKMAPPIGQLISKTSYSTSLQPSFSNPSIASDVILTSWSEAKRNIFNSNLFARLSATRKPLTWQSMIWCHFPLLPGPEIWYLPWCNLPPKVLERQT